MSRHYFDCRQDDLPIRVTLGYDRPTREFFLQVERRRATALSMPSYLYTSLADPENDSLDLAYYHARLISFGLVVPMSLFDAVWNDACIDRGNAVIEHFDNGSQRVIYEEKDRERD